MIHPKYWSEVAGAWWDARGPSAGPHYSQYEQLASLAALDRALQQMILDDALLTPKSVAQRDHAAYVRLQAHREISRARAAVRAIGRIHVRRYDRRGQKLPDDLAEAVTGWRGR